MTTAPIRRPDLDELETFLLAARHGSLTEAAAVLQLSKTAVAKRVRSLEAIVGHKLLDRGPRGATLTEHGRRFLPDVEALLLESERVFERLGDLRAGGVAGGISGLRSLSGSSRVSTEHVLRETEHFFAELFHSIDDGVVILSSDEHRILEANAEFARIVGRSREEILGRTASEIGFVTPQEQAGVMAAVSRAPIERQTIEIRAGSETRQVDFSLRLVTLGGEQRLLGIGRDVTERVRHEREIVRQAAQQQAVAELTLAVLGGESQAGLFTQAAELTASHLDASLAAVWEANGDEVELRSVHGVPRRRLTELVGTPGSRRPFLRALEAEGEVLSDELARDRRFSKEGIRTLGIRSIAAVRIGAPGGERLGVVVAAATEPAAFSKSDVEFIRSVANVLGLAAHGGLRAEAEARQQILLDNFTALVEASSDPSALFSLDGRFVYLNAAARSFRQSVLAVAPDSQAVFDGVDPRAARRLREVVLPATERDGRWDGSLTLQRSSGGRHSGRLTTVLVRDTNADPRWIAAIYHPAPR